jgi:hypothetical protein
MTNGYGMDLVAMRRIALATVQMCSQIIAGRELCFDAN